jgi:hypothetical protein
MRIFRAIRYLVILSLLPALAHAEVYDSGGNKQFIVKIPAVGRGCLRFSAGRAYNQVYT